MDPNPKTYNSNGKLLLTGEYAVLDGAKALALPTKFAQSLTVTTTNANHIRWKSYDEVGTVWFEANFKIDETNTLTSKNSSDISKRLMNIFNAVQQLNPEFFNKIKGCSVETHLDFNRFWGLGTSSTLITNLAKWAKVDAFKLLELTFGGSGYDVACATHNSPITYQKNNNATRINPVDFNPPFNKQLYFVYLNQKQNSRVGVSNYKKRNTINLSIENELNAITEAIIACSDLKEFNALLDNHEAIISKLIEIQPIKQKLFKDFNGAVKSLGAWGGDFILVSSETDPIPYFKSKGFFTIIPYCDMVR